MLVDNGVIRLRVLQKLHRRMRCEVLTVGELSSRRHINLPGVSGETTVGKYSLECLKVLNRIAQRIERSGRVGYAEKVELAEERQKIVRSAVVMANELKAKGILVFRRYGHMARYTSWLRPEHSAIFAFTNSERIHNQLNRY